MGRPDEPQVAGDKEYQLVRHTPGPGVGTIVGVVDVLGCDVVCVVKGPCLGKVGTVSGDAQS